MKYKLAILSFIFLLTACSSNDNDDLVRYIAEVKARPAGVIEPVPTFSPYEPFDYSATMLRGPFDKPSAAKSTLVLVPQSNVKPNLDRPREPLEEFNIESLIMVGTLTRSGQLWALLNDNKGELHYVKTGNYIGKNHGRIVKTDESYIQVVEIIAAGDGWIERPRTLDIREEDKR